MAIRPILHYPDPRLRIPGEPVQRFDDSLRELVDDMAETMYAAPGVGLAATQIGVPLQLFVIDVAMSGPSRLRTFINMEFIERTGSVCHPEGCLSFPGVSESIERFERVRVRAQDVTGQLFELEASGLLAIAIQHENDHIEGKLMVDHLSLLRRRFVHRAMMKRV